MIKFLLYTIFSILFWLNCHSQNKYTNFDNEIELNTKIINLENDYFSLNIQALQGFGPYLYSVDGGNTFVKDSTFIVKEGKYFIHVRDVNGLLGITFVQIENNSVIENQNIDTTALIEEWKTKKGIEKLNIQKTLHQNNVNLPIEITINGSNCIIPLLNYPNNIDEFLNRLNQTFPDLQSISLDQNNCLMIDELYISTDSFSKLINLLGYSNYAIVNN